MGDVMAKKTGEWVVRDAKTGRFLVETFRSDAVQAGARLATPGGAGVTRADYGRLLKEDVERYGAYIREKRLGRSDYPAKK